MPNQEIGVKSIWETKQFSRGLSTYLKGLTSAIAATNNTVAAINNMGNSANAVFAAIGNNSKTLVTALQAITAAAKAASTAAAKATSGRAPRVQVQNVINPVSGTVVQQINAATTATRNLGNQAKQTGASLQDLSTKSIALGVAMGTIAGNALIGLGRSLSALGGSVLEIVTFFERMNLSLNFFAARAIQAKDASISFDDALAQGAKEAEGLSIWLQRLAVASPFTTRGVSDIFRTAQAYGLTSEEAQRLTPQLLDLGAAAGLNEDVLLRVALALGQIRARGKLTGEEVRQLGNSSIPIRDILVETLGIANDQFDELLESGAFTSDIVIPAIVESLKSLEGAGKRVAFETIGGIVSAFEDMREIGIARFFTGALAPLKKSFQELFTVLNQPKVLAFIQVLGQELGVTLKNAVLGVVKTVQGLIAAWRSLDPVMQQQVIVFAAATAGVFLLVGAFGLLTIAVGFLLSPLVLIATTVGFLVSEWTSGFAVLKSITSGAARSIGGALSAIVEGIKSALNGLVDFLASTTDAFLGTTADFVAFGFNIGASLARGILASGSVLSSALGGIGRLLTFWLAPGSPPRIAPEIDDWGKATMEEYITAFGNANVKKALGNGLSIVSDTISDELIDARQKAVDRLNQAHPDLNLSLVDDLQRVVKEGYDAAEESFDNSDAVESAAVEAGIRVSDAFVNSFLSRIPALTPRISKELQDVLSKIGGGTQLTRQGALSFGKFLQGFGEADFGVLDETASIVEEFLQTLVDTGQIEEVDVARLLFGAREDLAQGIKDIDEVGHVTESTMQRIRASAGGASKFVLDLLNSYAPLAAATKAAEAAQETLNQVTAKYKAILTPLRKELEAINEASKLADEEEKILSLRRLIANQAVSDRRRQNAQLQINQIVAQRRVRGLEAERDAATEGAQEEVDAREKVREKLEEQFTTLQRNIQAQLTQLGLFGQEQAIIRKLREEAAKLREKEMTDDELRLKFLELQGEELSDLIEAARAKYDLDRADSTLLEKEAASIKLAEIALRRRNREAEAIKLGIPVEELTKLRDFEVTLDDIGVKTKEAFEFDPSANLTDGLVDANALTEEWEKTLTSVRDRWAEIKKQITDTAMEINNNLPSFLKIFPEVEGGEPPIIGFIKGYGAVIIGLAVAINTYKIVTRLAAVAIAIRNLATLGTIGGAAAAGGAAGAAGGAALTGAAAVVAGITSSLIAFTAIATAFILAAGGVDAAIKALDEHVFGGGIAEQLPAPAPETGFGVVADEVAQTVSGAVDFFKDPFARLREDAPANKEKLVQAYTLLPDEAQPARDSITTLLSGFADDEQQRVFAQSITSLVTNGVATGLSDAQISNQVSGAFNTGVAAGLIADTEANRIAIAAYATELLGLIRTQFGIKSPSKVMEAEIGFPLGQGIIKGINTALSSGSTQLVTTSNDMWDDLDTSFDNGREKVVSIVEAMRIALNTKFTTIRTALGLRMGEIVLAQNMGWTTVRTDSERETEALRVSTGIKFEAIRAQLFLKMAEIKNVVVNAFKAMRTESEAEVGELRASVINLLAGEEGSLLTDLNKAFLGLDQLVPRNIGKLFIEGIALGITENRQTLADAMIDALRYALITTAQAELQIASPSAVAAREIGQPFAQGIAQGILDGIGMIGGASRAATAAALQGPMAARSGSMAGPLNSATTTNVSRTNHYHLNVKSAMQSHGVVADFGIMETMRRPR